MKALVTLALCLASSWAAAADMPNTEWMKYTNPGAEHKALNDFAGKWKYTLKMWMEPNAKAEEQTGKSTTKWIMGGRFLQQEAKAKFQGQNFEGMGLTGYDMLRGEYQTVWIDNMSTSMMVGAGTYDTEKALFATKGDFACAMTGNKNRTYRTELKKVSKNEHTYSMFTTDTKGTEFKMMEITYKRM